MSILWQEDSMDRRGNPPSTANNEQQRLITKQSCRDSNPLLLAQSKSHDYWSSHNTFRKTLVVSPLKQQANFHHLIY